MNVVRWGVLSTAKIGMAKVTPAIQLAPNCEVVALASRDANRAAASAAQLGIETSYGSYEDLLAADIDAVYIPLPNDMHTEWTMKAVAAGKHVLCEKPVGMSAGEAAEMAKASRTAGVKLAEAFMYRHHPTWVEAQRLLAAGAIGELQAVQSWFSYFNDDPANIRNRLENGGGALMDIGCYNINLSRMLFGTEPARVEAAVRRDPEMGVDTLSSAILEFPGGGQATFTCATRSAPRQWVTIIGDAGHIEIEIPFNIPPDRETRILLAPAGQPTRSITFPPADQYTIQAELFAQAIIDDTEVPVPIEDAIANMEVIEAILRTA